MKLTAVFQENPEGGFTCWVKEIPQAISQGETLEEARENLRDALALVLTYLRDQKAAAGVIEEDLVPA